MIPEFRRYLAIDKSSLDDELIRQSELFFKVAEATAQAVAVRDAAKEGLANTDAVLDGQFRARKAGTEAAIKNAVQSADEHVAAFTSYLEAKLQADLLAGLKDSFKMRADMLDQLCRLYATSYFETNAVRGSVATNTVVYDRQRERLGEQRKAPNRAKRDLESQ